MHEQSTPYRLKPDRRFLAIALLLCGLLLTGCGSGGNKTDGGKADSTTADKGTKPDAERSLTATGHQRMKKIGKAIAEIFPKAEVILSSPLLRATQGTRHSLSWQVR